ncbi:MAG TPA: hypothetical protein VGN41_22135 [Streptosporangiaceae bacterium]
MAEGDGAADVAAEADVAQPAESPATAHVSAAAPTHRLVRLGNSRPAGPERPVTDGPGVALVPWALGGS